ncbi:type IV pilus modification protein PilV [Curvibacter sp. AEP1-3]|uniref:type IV pilus modification protein PilV n=1 Tax=Curvibacter sp. AEP1-3 TaxID=1844971 RepID=UPI000B3C192F|nr:type IV pilus modification protein PilV [Curvibacter sp. AEP1-3]
MKNKPISTRQRQSGATMIEILVSVLILTIGTLGMAGLQIRANKGNISASQRTQAVALSYFIIEALRVDKNNAKALTYNTGTLESNGNINGSICNPTSITGTDLADTNQKAWIEAIKANIGTAGDTSSCGAIYCDATGQCKVRVIWDDSKAGGLGSQYIETRVLL